MSYNLESGFHGYVFIITLHESLKIEVLKLNVIDQINTRLGVFLEISNQRVDKYLFLLMKLFAPRIDAQ